MRRGNSPASTSTLTSQLKGTLTRCPTPEFHRSLRAACAPRSSPSFPRATGWRATRAPASRAVTVRRGAPADSPPTLGPMAPTAPGPLGGAQRPRDRPGGRNDSGGAAPAATRGPGLFEASCGWAKAPATSGAQRPVAGRSRSEPVRLRGSNPASQRAWIAIACRRSLRPHLPPALPIAVAPSTTKKTKETAHGTPSDVGQTPGPAPARDVSRTRRAEGRGPRAPPSALQNASGASSIVRARSARTADSPPAGARPKCGRRPGSKPATRAHRVGGTKP
jgi:hypothetical protein